MFLLSRKFLIFLGICSTPKLSKHIALSSFRHNAIQRVVIDLNASQSITYAPSFILGKLFLEKAQLNLILPPQVF